LLLPPISRTLRPSWKLRAESGGLAICFAFACATPIKSSDPLAGRWVLNLARTHYGPGVDHRTKETFSCEATSPAEVACQIQSVRADGRSLLGKFVAAYDGTAYPVTGIPDVDHVRLQRIDAFIADATFSRGGTPVFAYRTFRAPDGRSLTVVSVDPVARTVLNSVVVYDAR
jgi:hypothetical protein